MMKQQTCRIFIEVFNPVLGKGIPTAQFILPLVAYNHI